MEGGRRGFTLVEIMIVVAIIAILAAIAIPELIESRKMSKQNRCLNNLKILEYATEQCALNLGLASGAQVEAEPGVEDFVWKFVNEGSGSDLADCPSGGDVDLPNSLGEPATCDYHGTISAPTPLSALMSD